MAQKPKGDEPAYPTADGNGKVVGGMTKRETMALGCVHAAAALNPDESNGFLARRAVALADELLKALDGG